MTLKEQIWGIHSKIHERKSECEELAAEMCGVMDKANKYEVDSLDELTQRMIQQCMSEYSLVWLRTRRKQK